MKRKIILVLFAAVMALGSSLYAADSKSKSTEENPQRLYTAEDYEGADLELFNMLKETSWRPKLKGFFEHTNPFSAGSKKSEKMAFKSNGEIWYTYGAAGHGSAAAFYSKRIKNTYILKEHNDVNFSFGFLKLANHPSRTSVSRFIVLQKRLCVFSRRVILQTCSIGLRSGE